MSYDKMEVDNSAEKEASEVLHSLLSVDRRALDSKENIIVSIPNMTTSVNGQEYTTAGEAQWHTPVMGQHSVFTLPDNQVIQQAEYGQPGAQQVIWQGHTIQIESANGVVGTETTILHEMYPMVTLHEAEVRHAKEEVIEMMEQKPKLVKKVPVKKKKKPSYSGDEGADTEDRNKLEANPLEVKARMKKGCDCKDSCYRGLIPENVYKHRLNIAELTKSEHDMYLMGVTMACLANPSETSRHKARRRLRASYVYQGRRVCLEAFLYLENVTHYQLKRIRHHVMAHGVAPRVHGNMGKKPYNTFSLDIYKHATEFLKQYLEQHSGGSKDLSKSILVQGDSRKNLFDAYKEYGEILEPGVKLMGYSTFRHFMKEQFPNVKFSPKKPEPSKDTHVPFKSGKCMSYDKNKDPARVEAEKAKAEAKKAAADAKKQQEKTHTHLVIQHQQQHQHQHQVVQQVQHQQQVVIQQQLQGVQVSQHQQVQQVQGVQVQQVQQVQVGQHQMVQQMNVQTVSDDSSSQPIEITQQVIPLTVVQQPQQTYIVTPVSHLQTTVSGGWYSRN